MRRVSEVLETEEQEELVARVAAIDVAKASGMVCTRIPGGSPAARRVTKVWEVSATTNAVLALADELAALGIERVVVESTSDYWRPFWYLLEARGLTVWLVNARDAKQVPGRPKTDKLDAVWLAKLNERGMLRPSFVPPVEIRQLRDYTRLRCDLTEERSRYKQRLEKLLEDALIKLSSVVADLFGVSARAMIEALIAGERDPRTLAAMARGRMLVKHAALVEALTGRFDAHHAELARMLLDATDALSARIETLTAHIAERISELPLSVAAPTAPTDAPAAGEALTVIQRLDAVPGIAAHAAQTIIAEIGLDMSRFPTPGHLVSWARLSPLMIQSGMRSRSGKTGKGNRYLKGVLGEVATAAAKTATFLGERYRRLARRIGKMRALIALARSILVIIWHLLTDRTGAFIDLGADFYDRRINNDRKTRQLVRQLQALGHHVTITPAA